MSEQQIQHPAISQHRAPASWHYIWHLSWPIILSNLTLPLVNAVDVAMMGHLSDPALVGGVSLGGISLGFLYLIFGFLKMSTTGLTAQAVGRRDISTIQLWLMRSAMVASSAGLLLMCLTPLLLPFLSWIFEADNAVEAHMSSYITFRIWAAPAELLNSMLLGWLFGLQQMRIGMIQLIAVNGINIGLNFLFVLGFGMEIEGVALASALAQWAGLAITLALIFRRRARFYLSKWQISFKDVISPQGWGPYIQLSRDISLRSILLFAVEAVLIAEAAKISVEILGASEIILVMFLMMAYGLDGFAHACETLVGEAIGQKNKANLKQVIWRSTLMAGGLSLCISVFYSLAGAYLIAIMTSQPDLIAACTRLWPYAVLLPVASFLAFQMDGVCIGATAGRFMRDSMILSVLIFAASLFILTDWLGTPYRIDALWTSFILYLVARGVFLAMRLPDITRFADADSPSSSSD